MLDTALDFTPCATRPCTRQISDHRCAATREPDPVLQYALPGDKLANPRAVYDSASPGAPVRKDWEIQGNNLLTNMTAIYIDYQYSVPEFAMPQYFVQLLKYMMSWHLAMPITEQTDKAQYWQGVAVGGANENGRGGYFRTLVLLEYFHIFFLK